MKEQCVRQYGILALVLVALAGCGGSSDSSTSTTTTSTAASATTTTTAATTTTTTAAGATTTTAGATTTTAAATTTTTGATTTTTASTTSTTLSLTSSATAKFSASQANANALAKELQSNIPNLVAVTTQQGIPASINALPGGVLTVNCTGSGNVSVTYNAIFTGSGPAAGASETFSYNDCVMTSSTETNTLNGTVTVTYNAFTSATDWVIVLSWSDLSDVATGTNIYTYGPASGSITLTFNNGTYTYSNAVATLANGGVTNITVGDVTYSGSNVIISSANYVYTSAAAGGVVTVALNNWTYSTTTGLPISGTITVTDGYGDTVVITASATGYTVVYTIGGVQSAYTVSYS